MITHSDAVRIEAIDSQGTPAPTDTDGFTLLVVDDSELNRDPLGALLRRQGYAADLAGDGASCLEMVRAGKYDLVLLDVMMPGLTGLEVLQQLRQTHSPTDLPVIMVTARGETEDIVHALELGANDYVTKPIDFPVVLARVRTQLLLKQSVGHIVRLEKQLQGRNAELEAANVRLGEAYGRLKRDVEAAAAIQQAFLPPPDTRLPGAEFAWAFRPCEELAGDFLGVVPFDDEHVGLYVLDVSGHGVASALLSVSLSRALSPQPGAASILTGGGGPSGRRVLAPAEVADRLSRRFPWDEATGQYFTILYGVLTVATGEFRYVSAGHPGAVRLGRAGRPEVLSLSGPPIGLADRYEQHAVRLDARDRLYLYSDGLTEAMNARGDLYGTDRLCECLVRGRSLTLPESVSALLDDIDAWHAGGRARDDVTVLAVEWQG